MAMALGIKLQKKSAADKNNTMGIRWALRELSVVVISFQTLSLFPPSKPEGLRSNRGDRKSPIQKAFKRNDIYCTFYILLLSRAHLERESFASLIKSTMGPCVRHAYIGPCRRSEIKQLKTFSDEMKGERKRER